jgi:hypothetical protein
VIAYAPPVAGLKPSQFAGTHARIGALLVSFAQSDGSIDRSEVPLRSRRAASADALSPRPARHQWDGLGLERTRRSVGPPCFGACAVGWHGAASRAMSLEWDDRLGVWVGVSRSSSPARTDQVFALGTQFSSAARTRIESRSSGADMKGE